MNLNPEVSKILEDIEKAIPSGADNVVGLALELAYQKGILAAKKEQSEELKKALEEIKTERT